METPFRPASIPPRAARAKSAGYFGYSLLGMCGAVFFNPHGKQPYKVGDLIVAIVQRKSPWWGLAPGISPAFRAQETRGCAERDERQ